MRDVRLATGLVIVALVGALESGCHFLSGLSDLTIDEGSSTGPTGGAGGSGGDGGTAATTMTGAAGGGGTGGTMSTGGCADGETNGNETDTDCGGPECDGCKAGAACLTREDCESAICLGPPGAKMCRSVISVAAGNAHVCAALDDGSLYCWGANDIGQLGVELVTESAVPVRVPIDKVTQVTAGGMPGELLAHTCALVQSEVLFCWGANGVGQLGKGDKEATTTPVQVASLTEVAGVAAGGRFTCAFKKDGALFCWGDNEQGQLGDGGTGTASAPDPVQLDGILVKRLAAGTRHACAVASNDELECWGDNSRGQAGVDPPSAASKLLAGPKLAGAARVAAGQDFTCARDATSLWCWGDNSDAELTSAVMDNPVATPASVRVAGVAELAAGADSTPEMGSDDPLGGHACAILDSGAVTCWGNNAAGQLGRGTIGASEGAPAEVPGLGGVTAIAAGTQVTCAILATGAVTCWGRNDRGQLGSGSLGGPSPSPVAVQWP